MERIKVILPGRTGSPRADQPRRQTPARCGTCGGWFGRVQSPRRQTRDARRQIDQLEASSFKLSAPKKRGRKGLVEGGEAFSPARCVWRPAFGVWRLLSIPAGKPGRHGRIGLAFGVWRLLCSRRANPTDSTYNRSSASSFATLAYLAPMPPGDCARKGGLCHRERKVSSERDAHPDQRHGLIMSGGASVETT
jgi:hypothetical protein